MAAGLQSFMVVTNPTKGGRRSYKRIRLNAPGKKKTRKKRTAAQKAATARLLMKNGMSARAARKSAGVKKGTRLKTSSSKRKPAKRTARKTRSNKGRARKKTVRKKTTKRTTKRKATKKKTTKRRTSMARKRLPPRIKTGPRKGQFRKKKASRKKASRKKKTTRRRAKRRNPKLTKKQRSAAGRKGARTKKANKAKRAKAGRKGAARKKRAAPKRRKTTRRRRNAVARRRPRRAVRRAAPKRRRRAVRRNAPRRRSRARRFVRRNMGARMNTMRYNRPKRRARRRNAAGAGAMGKLSLKSVTKALPKFAWGLGGLLGTTILGGTIGPYIPIGGAYSPVLVSTAGLAATWYLTDKVGFLRKHKAPILIGAGIGWAITFMRTVFPNLSMQLGIAPLTMPSNNGMSGYWAEGVAPIGPQGLSDYVRSGVLEGEYVPTGTSTLGAYVEEPLGIDVQEAIAGGGGLGAIYQAVAGGLGIDVFPVAQNGCMNCNRGSVVPMSAVPPASAAFPLAAREAALQKAGQITRDIAVRPPREMLGLTQDCGIYGGSIY